MSTALVTAENRTAVIALAERVTRCQGCGARPGYPCRYVAGVTAAPKVNGTCIKRVEMTVEAAVAANRRLQHVVDEAAMTLVFDAVDAGLAL